MPAQFARMTFEQVGEAEQVRRLTGEGSQHHVPNRPELVEQYKAPRMKPPYNVEARRKAGFTDAEMRFLLGEEG